MKEKENATDENKNVRKKNAFCARSKLNNKQQQQRQQYFFFSILLFVIAKHGRLDEFVCRVCHFRHALNLNNQNAYTPYCIQWNSLSLDCLLLYGNIKARRKTKKKLFFSFLLLFAFYFGFFFSRSRRHAKEEIPKRTRKTKKKKRAQFV